MEPRRALSDDDDCESEGPMDAAYHQATKRARIHTLFRDRPLLCFAFAALNLFALDISQ